MKEKLVLFFYSSHYPPNWQCVTWPTIKSNISFLVTMSDYRLHLSSHVGIFLVIASDLQQHEVMSSECWVEPCSEGLAEETGQENQQEEEAQKEEVEVPCWDNQPAGSRRQEEEPGGAQRPSSPDHSGMQEVTSGGGLEQVQREGTQTRKKRERLSPMTVKQENRDRGSGAWREK